MVTSKIPSDQVILATGGYDYTIRFWAPHNGQCLRIVQHPDSQVNAMDIVPCRPLLAAAGYQHIKMYDIENSNPNPVLNYGNVTKNVTSVGFQEEGRWMYTGGEDCCCRIWDLRGRNIQSQRMYNFSSPVNTCQLHPNQSEIYVGDQSGNIHLWDLRQDVKTSIHVDEVSIQHISIDPEGTCLAAVDNGGNCYMLSRCPDYIRLQCPPLQRRLKLKAHKRSALKCKFSPDSTLLATTSADQSAKLWRTADLLPLLKKEGEEESNSLSWSISESISPLVELKAPKQRWVWDIAFSADSQYVITASSDNMARLWDTNNGEVKREYNGHEMAVTALAFSDVFVE